MKKITIYTTRFCGYCNAAKKWLQQKGLEYQEIRLYEGNDCLLYTSDAADE